MTSGSWSKALRISDQLPGLDAWWITLPDTPSGQIRSEMQQGGWQWHFSHGCREERKRKKEEEVEVSCL
jgi:hypothetical protein